MNIKFLLIARLNPADKIKSMKSTMVYFILQNPKIKKIREKYVIN